MSAVLSAALFATLEDLPCASDTGPIIASALSAAQSTAHLFPSAESDTGQIVIAVLSAASLTVGNIFKMNLREICRETQDYPRTSVSSAADIMPH